MTYESILSKADKMSQVSGPNSRVISVDERSEEEEDKKNRDTHR
jgi:hypothetical protein